jgi:hypothetical protein
MPHCRYLENLSRCALWPGIKLKELGQVLNPEACIRKVLKSDEHQRARPDPPAFFSFFISDQVPLFS